MSSETIVVSAEEAAKNEEFLKQRKASGKEKRIVAIPCRRASPTA